jgi:NTP pyrophosphatase (non-canonical NTP hydrolase)
MSLGTYPTTMGWKELRNSIEAGRTKDITMNRLQYLLTKLAEEASEVAQMSLKTQQFGLDEVYIDKSNRVRLHEELDDLLTVINLLNTEFGFGYMPNEEYVINKINKIAKYYQYSVDLGMVTIDFGAPNNENPNQEPKA